MARKKQEEKEVVTLEQVEEALESKNEELISDEKLEAMDAEEKPLSDEIKEAFENTDMPEDGIDDGLEHMTPEELESEAVEPIKELVDEAKELAQEKDEVLENVTKSTPEEAAEKLQNQINKVELFKKKLQDVAKKKTPSQIIHSWNGVNYSF